MADKPAQAAAAGILDDVANDQETLLDHQAMDGEVFGTPAPLQAEPFITEEPNVATDEVEQSDDGIEIPEISWETPEDLQELLDAPDFEDDDDEPAYTPQAQTQEWGEEEPETEREAALRRQLAKLQKKAEWAEEQKVKASRKQWESEARKYFQFSNPDLIEAKSRRAFLKQAQAQHEAVAKVAKPVFDQLAQLKQRAYEEGLAKSREEAAQRWGRPTSGPQAANNIETTQSMQRERLQHGRGLADVIKSRFRSGEVNL